MSGSTMPNSDRCHKPRGVAELGKLPGPVVGIGAGFHTDQAGWQVGYEFEQLGTWDFWAHQGRFACFIDAMHSEDVLGEVNSNGYVSPHYLIK